MPRKSEKDAIPAKKAAPRKAPPKKAIPEQLPESDPNSAALIRRNPKLKKALIPKAVIPISMLNVRIGERTFPVRRDPQCTVCIHPGRAYIERELLINTPYQMISRMVSDVIHQDVTGKNEEWYEISPEHISDHFRAHHCPINTEVGQAILRQVLSDEISYEDLTQPIVDALATMNIILQVGTAGILDGSIKLNANHVVAVSSNMLGYELKTAPPLQDTGTVEAENLRKAMEFYFQTAHSVMNEEQWDAFSARLRTNSVLEQYLRSASAVEAELIDNPKEGAP